MTHPFSSLVFKRWYQFGFRSPYILYKRLRNGHPWGFNLKMAWQRARHEFSDEQCWSLSHTQARLTVIGVQKMRKWANGYPVEFSEPPYGTGNGWSDWDAILARIEEGFQAWLDEDGWFSETENAEAKAKFEDAMALYAKWFTALWD